MTPIPTAATTPPPVFSRSKPGSDDAAISHAIGTATAQAVTALREEGS